MPKTPTKDKLESLQNQINCLTSIVACLRHALEQVDITDKLHFEFQSKYKGHTTYLRGLQQEIIKDQTDPCCHCAYLTASFSTFNSTGKPEWTCEKECFHENMENTICKEWWHELNQY
jgi:hypothetical protein